MRHPAIGILAVPALLACGESLLGPPASSALSAVGISATTAGTSIRTLVVTVSAADLPGPLVFNLEAVDGRAEGTVRVPPGPARLFTVEAHDASGEITHDGARVVDIAPGVNPPVSIPLTSRSGQVPVTLVIGDWTVLVAPAALEMPVGGTHTLVATVIAPNQETVEAAVIWATTDPGLARVDAAGVVTALAPGDVDIVAIHQGIAGSARVTVSAEPQD